MYELILHSQAQVMTQCEWRIMSDVHKGAHRMYIWRIDIDVCKLKMSLHRPYVMTLLVMLVIKIQTLHNVTYSLTCIPLNLFQQGLLNLPREIGY